MGNWTVIHGDALFLPIPDNSVDLVITDPPYYKQKAIDWDRQWKTDADYLQWVRLLCRELRKVLRPNGSLYLFAAPDMAARVECVVREEFNVLNRIRWIKEQGWHKKTQKEELRCFLSNWEEIIFAEPYYSDDSANEAAGYESQCDALHKKVYAPIGRYIQQERERAGFTRTEVEIALGYISRTDPTRGTALCYRWEEGSSLPTKEAYERLRVLLNSRGNDEYLRKEYEELRRPFFLSAKVPYTDVWEFPTVSASPWKHLCEKPVALISHIIRCSSRPGNLVLDSCMGSGATGIAAIRNNRRFIGIEKDPIWVRRAYHWIDQEARQGQLFSGEAA